MTTSVGLDDLTGLWERSLMVWPDGRRDVTTPVLWLQGPRSFGDLRQPAPYLDSSRARGLSDLSRSDCESLATQQGFAGRLNFDGQYFEWVRHIDYQPPSEWPDAGSLAWDGATLIEKGRDSDYVEHWRRAGALPGAPSAALTLCESQGGRRAVLVRVGDSFMFARDRSIPLTPHATLRECVAAASLDEARRMIDCELSFGNVANGFLIERSTLPYRRGDLLEPHIGARHATLTERDPRGAAQRRTWTIIDREGERDAWRGLA